MLSVVLLAKALDEALPLLAAICTAAAVGAFLYPFAAAMFAERNDTMLLPEEKRRRAKLRQEVPTYRRFEPMIVDLAARITETMPVLVERLQADLDLIEPNKEWRAGEYYAIRRVESWLMFAPAALFGGILLGPLLGLLFAGVVVYLYPLLGMRSVQKKAKVYRIRLRSRLPFVADLSALILEGGGTFSEAMVRIAQDNPDHPIGQELARTRSAVERSVPEGDALRDMSRRVDDPDLAEFVFVVNTAIERGTPLKDALRDMAERLRGRRVQWLERMAEEAKVKISGPALLVMIACLAVIVAPFLLASSNPTR